MNTFKVNICVRMQSHSFFIVDRVGGGNERGPALS